MKEISGTSAPEMDTTSSSVKIKQMKHATSKTFLLASNRTLSLEKKSLKTMESEVAVLLTAPATDFNFDSGCSTPYISAPSSPARMPNFLKSDSQLVENFCRQFRQLPSFKDARDEKMGLEERSRGSDEEADFAFDSGGRSDGQESIFAEELFDGGKIRVLKTELKTPVTFPAGEVASNQLNDGSSSSYPGQRFWNVFQFSKVYRKWKLKDLLFRSKSAGGKPVAEIAAEAQNGQVMMRSSSLRSVESFRSNESSGSFGGSNRRRMRKGEVVECENDVVNGLSFRSNGGSNRRGGRARSVSAHELHYTFNRAASEEMKRRTFLPYKQGLLGCLGFGGNPTAVNEFVGRVGSMTRG